MSNRVRKQTEGQSQKMGPMKATIPMPTLLKSSLTCGGSTLGSNLVSPMRHISPEHTLSGHRSPGALSYKGITIYIHLI